MVGQDPPYLYGEFTIQVQQHQKKTSISDTAKNVKTLQETTNERLSPSYTSRAGIHHGSTS